MSWKSAHAFFEAEIALERIGHAMMLAARACE
jgi:hypothetical protein